MSKRGKNNIGHKIRNKNCGVNSVHPCRINLLRCYRRFNKSCGFKMTTHKLLHALTYTTFALTFILTGVIAYYLIFPLKVIEFSNIPFPVINVNKTVKVGSLLQHKVEYCKHIDLTATASRQFINGLIFSMPSSIVNNPIGCNTSVVNTMIPLELPPGKYFLRTVIQYNLNPIRAVTFTIDTEQFTVVK